MTEKEKDIIVQLFVREYQKEKENTNNERESKRDN